MTEEEEAAISAIQKAYQCIRDHRDPKVMNIRDDVLASHIAITRLLSNKIDKLPPRWAHDVAPQPNLRSSQFAEYDE